VTNVCDNDALSRERGPGVGTGVDALVARLRTGDLAAFDEAYARYHARLFGFLARVTGRRDIAHDLLQETWIRLATRAANLRDDTRLDAWLFTVARNLSVSFQRWRMLERQGLALLGGAAAADASPFDLTAAAQLEQGLEAALAALPLRYREVVLLVAVEGLTPQEVAGILRLRPENVRQRLRRARDMIEKRLAAHDTAPARTETSTGRRERSPR
jgi:RNA polymerase sigma-70 factor (ECF subfamily)